MTTRTRRQTADRPWETPRRTFPSPVSQCLAGQSLDANIQRTMESEMGDSFSDVQVHTGPRAAQACEDINAKAFTVGNNIAFNQGEYDPGSPEGQHVLAHVRQQTGGAVSMLPQNDLELEIDPDPELEKEAEETAQRVMQGGELGIQRMSDTDVHVQRFSVFGDEEEEEDNWSVAEGEPEQFREKVERVVDDKVAELAQSTGISGQSETAQTDMEQARQADGVDAESEQEGGLFSRAVETTKSVGSDIAEGTKKGTLGSLAGMGGKLAGKAGGATVGAALGGAVGSVAGPIGTGLGVAAGKEVGQTLGGEVGKGVASDTTKQLADTSMSVEDLEQKYNQLQEEVQELKKNSNYDTDETSDKTDF